MNLVGHLGHKGVLILFTFNLIIKCGISHFSLSFSPVLSA
ncbi:putative membrane protein [Synechococcus sp. PROS-7-1]|nr:putative membrane protein [Synechococcus sp. PROS-7-1]